MKKLLLAVVALLAVAAGAGAATLATEGVVTDTITVPYTIAGQAGQVVVTHDVTVPTVTETVTVTAPTTTTEPPPPPTEPPPPTTTEPPPADTLTVTDRTFVCSGHVDYDLVKVTVSGDLPRTDAVRFANGCNGRIGRLEVDTSNADGIHIGAGAHDLVVESGYVRSHGVCGSCGSVHVDGIQALGGQRITMTLDVDYPTATNSALYINMGSGGQDRPTDVVCDGCTFKRSPDKNRVVRIGNSLRSGIRNSTVYWCGTGPTCDAPQAPAVWFNGLETDPVNENTTLVAVGG